MLVWKAILVDECCGNLSIEPGIYTPKSKLDICWGLCKNAEEYISDFHIRMFWKEFHILPSKNVIHRCNNHKL